jgi:hypothetical protein
MICKVPMDNSCVEDKSRIVILRFSKLCSFFHVAVTSVLDVPDRLCDHYFSPFDNSRTVLVCNCFSLSHSTVRVFLRQMEINFDNGKILPPYICNHSTKFLVGQISNVVIIAHQLIPEITFDSLVVAPCVACCPYWKCYLQPKNNVFSYYHKWFRRGKLTHGTCFVFVWGHWQSDIWFFPVLNASTTTVFVYISPLTTIVCVSFTISLQWYYFPFILHHLFLSLLGLNLSKYLSMLLNALCLYSLLCFCLLILYSHLAPLHVQQIFVPGKLNIILQDFHFSALSKFQVF